MTQYSPAYRRWMKRIESYKAGVPIPKSLINAAKASLAPWKRTSLTESEKEALLQAFCPGYSTIPEPLGWAITPEQTEQGLNWLCKLPMRWRLFAREAFDHFTFDGLQLVEDPHGRPIILTVPVYRIHFKDGSSVAYSARPWHSRGKGCPYELLR